MTSQPVNDRGELMVCADDNDKIYHYTRDSQPVNDRGALMVCADDQPYQTGYITDITAHLYH